MTGVTLPITKHNYLVMDTHELPYIIREAFYIARTGRPGPVLVDIPKDVQNEVIEFVYPEGEIRRRVSSAGTCGRGRNRRRARFDQQSAASDYPCRTRNYDGGRVG